MEWDASLETGIPIVDAQHQALFRQVADLLDDSKANRVRDSLVFLGDYVIMHFGTEEMMHKTFKYPKASEHKKTHDDFVAALGELKNEYASSGDSLVILMKITKIALDWLSHHVKRDDREFAEYFKASGFTGSRMPPDESVG